MRRWAGKPGEENGLIAREEERTGSEMTGESVNSDESRNQILEKC